MGLPASQLLARGLGDEIADGLDEARLLCEGDELGGGQDLAAGVTPPHQRLGSNGMTVAQVMTPNPVEAPDDVTVEEVRTTEESVVFKLPRQLVA